MSEETLTRLLLSRLDLIEEKIDVVIHRQQTHEVNVHGRLTQLESTGRHAAHQPHQMNAKVLTAIAVAVGAGVGAAIRSLM